jgi:hypothetical protein
MTSGAAAGGRTEFPAPSDDLNAAKETYGEAFLAWYPKFAYDDDGEITNEIVGGAWGITSWSGSWDEPEFLNASGDFFGDDFEFAAEPTHWLPLPPDVPNELVAAAIAKSGGAS